MESKVFDKLYRRNFLWTRRGIGGAVAIAAAVTGTLEAFVIAMPLATVLIDSTNSLALPGIAIAAALGVFLIVDLSTIIRSRQTALS